MTRPPADESELDDALAAARPAESPAIALARAKVAGALFGAAAVGLGRFRVLERLGGGGMGVVYAAYDPELDRGVALKTVRMPHGGRELALHEAKALAKLSHPNVVPVFDVGLTGEHVYIVMELVRGETLRAFVAGKPLAAILDVYRQAGQALAAAHSAGLVHRDFKPDNAIVGTDGRVRVVDFGLACEAATVTAGAGTSKYMAPEQAAGGLITPAADQYSFAVSLAEAIEATGAPPPRWIADIIERGSMAAPEARFPTMADLLRALGRDPARLRRRRLAAGGGVVAVIAVGIAAFAIGSQRAADEPAPCSGGEREIAAAWPTTARAAQLARIAQLSPYGKELALALAQQLADHAGRWASTHRDVCLAHRRGLLVGASFDRRMSCLDRNRAALAALGDIVAAADARVLPDVARAARAVGDPDACADPRVLVSDVEPPPLTAAGAIASLDRDLERARVQIAAAKFGEARALAAHAVDEARALSYRPALAEALLVEGRALIAIDDAAGIARLGEAVTVGLESGSTAVAVEAWARRAWYLGTSDAPGDALGGLDVVEALAMRTPAPFPRALLHNNVGNVELAREHPAAARAAFQRSLDEARGLTGPGAVELMVTRLNMALVVDDPVRRDALLAENHALYAKLLGPDHPDTLTAALAYASIAIEAMPRAAALLDATCPAMAMHELLVGRTAACWSERADLAAELGDSATARTAIEHALALLGTAIPGELSEIRGYAALWRGDPAAAAAAFTHNLGELARLRDEPWYRRFARAKQQLGLARALRASHRARDAIAQLQPAIATMADVVRDHPAVAYERRLGRARAELAYARADVGDDPRAVAQEALGWLRRAQAPAAELAALERLVR